MNEDWTRYWRSPNRPLEAMHAHFTSHAYHRHSHDTYSFGVTESGLQAFHCRGGAHTSTPGMVLALNPDEPHDGHAGAEPGFTYRIIHIGPDLVRSVLSDATGAPGALPLFPKPVVDAPDLAATLRRLHTVLTSGAPRLDTDEALHSAVLSMVRGGAATPSPTTPVSSHDARRVARHVRSILHERLTEDLDSDDLADAVGRSRHTVHRAFRAVEGMAPGDYRRQLRLRRARTLITAGAPLAEAAAHAGFADQSHLTRWFTRYYGVTPGVYRAARGRVVRTGPEGASREHLPRRATSGVHRKRPDTDDQPVPGRRPGTGAGKLNSPKGTEGR
ncbi:AraC family ligand binding domain-containing protein [Nocardiopsis sp. EMB25]|uniref:AraC family ligand binding domain-containing protein n=1 Tax=Nocardiopsis sp. EMB25 TaxID=2835867 RepID=UPI0022833812|nr:AraC family ligand binding domain-containing protein [Nocardiopsis sp. EMB25]MCY9783203.1 AraC family ligand binding domain-containing protein [Nocardiopsis sp. EMB25]